MHFLPLGRNCPTFILTPAASLTCMIHRSLRSVHYIYTDDSWSIKPISLSQSLFPSGTHFCPTQILFSGYISRSAVRPRHPSQDGSYIIYRLQQHIGHQEQTPEIPEQHLGRMACRSLGMNNFKSSNLCTRGWNGNLEERLRQCTQSVEIPRLGWLLCTRILEIIWVRFREAQLLYSAQTERKKAAAYRENGYLFGFLLG